MKNADRLRRLIANTRHATDKEEAFFDFLLISPSYQLARKRRLVGLSDDEQSLLPSDFNRVLEIYDVCGDIFGMDFEDWWDERGRDLLRSSESNEDLIAYPPATAFLIYSSNSHYETKQLAKVFMPAIRKPTEMP